MKYSYKIRRSGGSGSKAAARSSTDAKFVCVNCGREVGSENAGTHNRNHCPYCLHSLHLDNIPGDRSAGCGGLMEPIAIFSRRDGRRSEWAVIHRCKKCGVLHSNRIAADDDPLGLTLLALRPLTELPFPLEIIRNDK